MELGLHIANFTWTGGAATLRDDLGRLAKTAEDVGFTRVTVMDHFWQIRGVGPEADPMLEAYTALGYLAAVTDRVQLHTLVTGVTYREPALLAKAVTTLDVLSGGRAGLGIGAAWNDEESAGLGFAFPSTAERFERLEEAIQICLQMWSDDESSYQARHYQLGRTLNSPNSLSKPHPPLMIGGSGERKTLRLVARYADQCNLFGSPELAHKIDVLRGHCETEGRKFDDIEITSILPYDPASGTDALLEALRGQHEQGVAATYLFIGGPQPLDAVERIGADVIPEISNW